MTKGNYGNLIYVMGPSGAGKDTLLGFAREHLHEPRVLFAHRYITRPSGNGENHVPLTSAEFEARSSLGLFALEWASHGLRYGIGIELDAWLARGCTVVVNGSRAYLDRALERYAQLHVVQVEAAPDVLATRLASRGRETAAEVAARLAREAPFCTPAGVALTRIDNSGSLHEAGRVFVEVVRRIAG